MSRQRSKICLLSCQCRSIIYMQSGAILEISIHSQKKLRQFYRIITLFRVLRSFRIFDSKNTLFILNIGKIICFQITKKLIYHIKADITPFQNLFNNYFYTKNSESLQTLVSIQLVAIHANIFDVFIRLLQFFPYYKMETHNSNQFSVQVCLMLNSTTDRLYMKAESFESGEK